MTTEHLEALRQLMKKKNVDAVIVPGTDPHHSEYVSDHWKFRDWLTGHGVFATIRASRGEDIWAACGMLSTAKNENQS